MPSKSSRGLVQRGILAGCGALVILAVCSSRVWATTPTVSPNPNGALPGQTVIITGTGWGPSSDGYVYVFLDRSAAPLARATPNAAGSFSEPLTVPSKPPGTYSFFACQLCGDVDGGERSAIFFFTITPPALTLSPATAPPGQTVTATGTGWRPADRGGEVRIFADPSAVTDPSATPLATATPESAGTFSVPLTVPNKPPGTYRFVACQRCNDPDGGPTAHFFFTITPLTTRPTVSTTVPTTSPRPTVTQPRPTVTQPRPTVTQPPVVTSSPIGPTPSPYPTLAIVLAVLVLLAIALWWFFRQLPTARWRRPTWEAQAEDAERQGPCHGGSWYCHRGSPQLNLRFRRITALPVSIFSSETGRARRQINAGDDVLAALNRCLDHQRAGRGAALVRRTAAAAAWGTWAVIQRELAATGGPSDVFLSIDVQGGQATCPFTLYQCRQAKDSTSRWTRRAEWTGKVKDEKRYAVAVLRAAGDVPTMGDVVTEALAERFADVVRAISTDSLLQRIRLDSEWELDLGRWGRIHW
jgi:hypothetical protein